MTRYEETHPNAPRNTSDKITAMRTASLVSMLAGFWLFVSPWAFYGLSDQRNAWNAWIVGFLIFAVSGLRVARPMYSIPFGWANVVLGLWVLISPWVYGFASDRARMINNLSVGAFVVVMALASMRVPKMNPPPDSI